MENGNPERLAKFEGDPESRGCPSFMDLATFVERSVDERARSPLAQHVASCERCAMLAAAVESGSDQMVFVPPHVLEAAKALVPGASGANARQAWLLPALRWGSAVAAAVLISALGYQVGGGMQASATADVGDQLAIELSFDLMGESDFEEELQLFPTDQQAVMQ